MKMLRKTIDCKCLRNSGENYGCLFVAKFNDWFSCVQPVDLNSCKNWLFYIQQ